MAQGGTYKRTDERMYGKSPHSTGLRPLSGPLPKNEQTFIQRLEGFDQRQVSYGDFVIAAHSEGVGGQPLRRPEGIGVTIDGVQNDPDQPQPPDLMVGPTTRLASHLQLAEESARVTLFLFTQRGKD